MSEFTKDEAVAFIAAIHLALGDRVGLRWQVERLSSLSAYVESIANENERLNAFVDGAGLRGEYEAFCAAQPDST